MHNLYADPWSASVERLRNAALFARHVAARRPSEAGVLIESAEAFEAAADRLESDPRGVLPRGDARADAADTPAVVVAPRTHLELAVATLRDAAAFFEMLSARNPAIAEVIETRMAECREAAARLDMTRHGAAAPPTRPPGPFDPALKAYHDRLRAMLAGRGSPFVDPERAEVLLKDEAFMERARAVYRAETGRDLDAMPQVQRLVVLAPLAAVWLEDQAGFTDTQRSELAYGLSNPRADWFMPPLLPGDWRDMAPADALDLMVLFGKRRRVGEAGVPLPCAMRIDRVRTRWMACHGDTLMFEAQGYDRDGRPSLISGVFHAGGFFLADGRSDPIYALNDELSPAFETAQGRLDYVRLFMNWVRGDEGRFQPIETGDELDHRCGPDAVTRRVARDLARPIEEGEEPGAGWRYRMRVVYADAVFSTDVILLPDGVMHMVEDEPLQADLPMRAEVQNDILLSLVDRAGGLDQ